MIDTHLHPLADDLDRYPASPIGGVQSGWSRGVHLTADEILEHMVAAGVDQATLVQASTAHGYDNAFCADCCAHHPDRFVGVCCIDPLAAGAPDTLSSWIETRGMRGVRLFCTSGTDPGQPSPVPEPRWLNDPRTYPTWERAEQLRIPVAIMVRASGLDMVGSMAERFPGINVLLDHLGGPSLDDGPPYAAARGLWSLSPHHNIFLKFTTNTIREAARGASEPRAFFDALIDRFGVDRLVWGSNFPATRGSPSAPYAEIVEEAQQALSFLSTAEQDLVFGGTARSLYSALGVGGAS